MPQQDTPSASVLAQTPPTNPSPAWEATTVLQAVTEEELLDFEIEELSGRLALTGNAPYGGTGSCSCHGGW